MTLVQIHCRTKGCRRLLDEVTSAPAPTDEDRWAGTVFLHVCPRCHPGAGSGDVASWQANRRRQGLPDDRETIGRWAPWSELRPKVEEARRTGRIQTHLV